MCSVEDMKSCIQEWFSQCLDFIGVVKTYSEIQKETVKQMEFMAEQYSKKDN